MRVSSVRRGDTPQGSPYDELYETNGLWEQGSEVTVWTITSHLQRASLRTGGRDRAIGGLLNMLEGFGMQQPLPGLDHSQG